MRSATRIALLATKYNEIRSELPPGRERDLAMREVFEEMVTYAKASSSDNVEVQSLLRDATSDGRRLAGYAYVQANPRVQWLLALVEAIQHEKKPFNEEMALKALRILLRRHCDSLDARLRTELQRRREKYDEEARREQRSSKRAAEIEELFKECPG
jgi:hypothetical protein